MHHLLRRRYVENVTRTVDRLSEAPPEALGGIPSPSEAVQAAYTGTGPLVLRSYEVDIRQARLAPNELMERMIERPGDLNDSRIAGFVRDDEPATTLRRGDDLVVELPGPWNGPVRVVHADSSGLLLQTLDGHMEAGQIRFDTAAHVERPDGTHDYLFRVRSWARGGDAVFTVLHLGVRVAKELQTAMWVALCHGAMRVAEGTRHRKIRVTTEILAESSPAGDVMGDTLETLGGPG